MKRLLVPLAFAAMLCAACTSATLAIETPPMGPGEEEVGIAEGRSTGIMLFQFIPIGQNERFNHAYQEALATSGGTRLVNVKMSEHWFWAWVFNGYTFKVTGTAVRQKAAP